MPRRKTKAPVAAVLCPVEGYAKAVVSGEIVTGKLVRLACERHLRDLKEGPARGLYWDTEAAQIAINFFGLLHHSKGKWAGKPFELLGWQKFFVGSIAGWKRADGFRRFQVAHLEVARKNGKTTLAAGLALALLVLDQEPGGEVYCCATKRDQAKLTFDPAAQMVRGSASLRKLVTPMKNNLSVTGTGSKLEPLGADADTLDGLSVSGAIMDELHAWKQRLLWDVMETSTGARDQPLFVITTTAGYNRQSIWWERRELAIKVLEGVYDDDELFALIYTLDDSDEWTEEKNWIKGNPGLGETVQLGVLRKKCEEARQSPGKQNPFKRLRLNMLTEQADRWLDLEVWDACKKVFAEDMLRGRECYSALDLASTIDLSALAHLFPPNDDDPLWRLLLRCFVPQRSILRRVERDRVPYDVWVQEGLLIATPGEAINYPAIKKVIQDDAAKFQLRQLAFDRMFATQLIQDLMDEGMDCIAFGQGFLSMAGPCKELEGMLASQKIAHNGDKVLRWMASNVAVKQDPAGNYKPDKKASSEKIDGIVALLMALGISMARPGDSSVYSQPGSLAL